MALFFADRVMGASSLAPARAEITRRSQIRLIAHAVRSSDERQSRWQSTARFCCRSASRRGRRRKSHTLNYSGNRACAIEGHDDALPNGFAAPYMARVPLFWLNYCHPDGRFDRFAGVVVVESHTHLHASMKAEVSGADRGLNFAGAHELDAKSARQVPADMIGRGAFSCTGQTEGALQK